MIKKAISWAYDRYLDKSKMNKIDKETVDKLIAKGKEMINDPIYCYIDGKRYRRDEVDKLIAKGKEMMNDPIYCYINGKRYRRDEVNELIDQGKKKLGIK